MLLLYLYLDELIKTPFHNKERDHIPMVDSTETRGVTLSKRRLCLLLLECYIFHSQRKRHVQLSGHIYIY